MSNDAVTRGGSHTSYNNLVFLCDGSELPTLRKMRCATCRMHVSHQMREVTVHHASLPLASCTWVCEICRRVTWSRL